MITVINDGKVKVCCPNGHLINTRLTDDRECSDAAIAVVVR